MTSRIFNVPKETSFNKVKSWLLEELPVQQEHQATAKYTYLDTFDWRVFNADGVLELLENKTQNRLMWRSLGAFEIYASQFVEDAPRFAWNIADPRLRRGLERILDVRALLPLVVLSSRVCVLRMRDNEQKTVLRIELQHDHLTHPSDSHRIDLGVKIRFLPVRGYGEDFEKTAQLVQRGLHGSPIVRDPLVQALEAMGRQPGDYSSKLRVDLKPDLRADAAAKTILLHLVDTMIANEDGLSRDLDSEFLHDFRVAVRRTRSLLGQVKQIFPRQRVDRFRREFAWLGQATSPMRDTDVYLLAFDNYQASLPAEVRGDLAPLKTFLEKHKHQDHLKVTKVLKSARYRRLIEQWRAFLEADVPKRSRLANAGRPVIEVANERIWRVYRKVIKDGGRIKSNTPANELHKLRITCKKLRYLMEFFRSLYAPDKIDRLIKTLKGFQDNLGAFQDLEVQQESLRSFTQAMKKEMELNSATEHAIDLLIEGLARRQRQVRQEFHARFKQFAVKKNRKRFEKLFSTTRQAPAPGS